MRIRSECIRPRLTFHRTEQLDLRQGVIVDTDLVKNTVPWESPVRVQIADPQRRTARVHGAVRMIAARLQDSVDEDLHLLAGSALPVKNHGDVVPRIVLEGRLGLNDPRIVHAGFDELARPEKHVVRVGVPGRDSLGDDAHAFVAGNVARQHPGGDAQGRHALQLGDARNLNAVGGVAIVLQALADLPIDQIQRAMKHDGRGIGRGVNRVLGIVARQMKNETRRGVAHQHQHHNE